MPFVDPDTGEINNAAFALDTHAATNDEPSILDSAVNVVTKAAPLTVLSAVNSFVNTGIEVDNWLTDGNKEKVTVQDELGDGSYTDYYKQHEQGIELAGLIGGSLIPGTLAVKGASWAVKGAFLAKSGLSSEALVQATGLLSPLKGRLVQGALDELAEGPAGYFANLDREKTIGIALGAGDQALQGAVFTAATAATMHASPLLDQQDLSDVANDVMFGAVTGGLVGGILEGIGTRAFFNKAIQKADIASKAQQLQERLGLGNYTAGDRVSVLLDSLDKIPEPTNALESKHAQGTRDSAMLEARKKLNTLVPKGEEDVGNAAFDLISQLPADERSERLLRLDKLGRYTGGEVEGTIPTGDTFYINKFARGENPQWEDLVTTSPLDSIADKSLRYTLRDNASTVGIGRAGSTFTAPDGRVVPLFTTVGEAWDANMDIFIDGKSQIHVNPDAPNIEGRVARAGESRMLTQKEDAEYRKTGDLPAGAPKLYGAPVVLDTNTGALTTSATPVVGDFGRPEVIGDTLRYGDELSKQGSSSVLTSDTSTIDANARYVWAAQRGIKAGDTVAGTDIPMLEQLYREASAPGVDFDKYIQGLGKKGVTLPAEFTSSGEILDHIRVEKDSLISQLSSPSSKLGVDEIALRANTTQDYITNGLKAENAADYMRDPDSYLKPNHVKLEYNLGSVLHQDDGMIARGAIDTQYRIGLAKTAAQDALASYAGPNWNQFVVEAKASDADIRGISSHGFLGAANSDYGTIGQELQRVGRMLSNLVLGKNRVWQNGLAAPIQALKDNPQAAAEWGMFRAIRQGTNSAYTFLPADLAKQYGVSADTAVLSKSLTRKAGEVVDWKKDYVPDGFQHGEKFGADSPAAQPFSYYQLSPEVANFERAQSGINKQRLLDRDNWRMAQGLPAKYKGVLDDLYTPPVDTSRYPFFAYVKNIRGTGMADDGVAVITAASNEELQAKIAGLSSDFSVYTKSDLKSFHEVEGDYQYNRNFAQSAVNSALEKRGILNNILPDTRADTIVRDYVDWNSKQELSLARDHVELGNAQLFAELRAMGERFQNVGTSETGFVSGFAKRTVSNPYDSYIQKALAVGPKEQNYPLWSWANEKLEAYFSTAFGVARNAAISAKKGLVSYEQAASMSEKYGLGNVYERSVGYLNASAAYYGLANKIPSGKELSKFVGKASTILGASVIRLDTWQQLIHAVTDPMLAITEASSVLTNLGKAGDSALGRSLTTELPDGTARRVPSLSKAIFRTVGEFFDPSIRKPWVAQMTDLGIIRDSKMLDGYHQMLDDIALPTTRQGSLLVAAEQKLNNASDFVAKYITQSDNVNDIMHFFSSRLAYNIFSDAGYQGKQLLDNVGTFQSRVFGNYTAAQRPVAFSGPIGQAMGLFQTFYLNLMQQVFRHIENGEGKTLAILGGMQTSLFGMQSLPGFQAVNAHLIGNLSGSNPDHNDLYSGLNSLLDKKLGDFITYGAVSNFTGAGLYTRGDINPRAITLLPVNPADYPAVRSAVRFIGSMLDTLARISQGGNIPASILLGLEHNGLSRPLTGLAELMQGFSTTSQGRLVSANAGWSDFYSAANFSRLLGARPLDEAITMDQLYRNTLYKAKDNQRLTSLGEAVKTTMYGGEHPTGSQLDNFATEYAKAGGEISSFSGRLMNWTMQANASVANGVYSKMKQSGTAKNMMMIMGGVPLPDYLNGSYRASQGAEDAASTAGGNTEGSNPTVP